MSPRCNSHKPHTFFNINYVVHYDRDILHWRCWLSRCGTIRRTPSLCGHVLLSRWFYLRYCSSMSQQYHFKYSFLLISLSSQIFCPTDMQAGSVGDCFCADGYFGNNGTCIKCPSPCMCRRNVLSSCWFPRYRVTICNYMFANLYLLYSQRWSSVPLFIPNTFWVRSVCVLSITFMNTYLAFTPAHKDIQFLEKIPPAIPIKWNGMVHHLFPAKKVCVLHDM